MKFKKTRGLINEFKEFIMRGNVIDMAVGVIVAGAFGKITTSLVNDVFMPFIGWLIGGFDLSKLNIVLAEEVLDEAGAVVSPAVTIGIGTFLVTIIDFLIIAAIVFMIVKVFAKAKELSEKARAKQVEEEVAEDPKPTTEELLTEILAEIKKK
ncbi:MAG: large conductance mechanosensitive channel protein MscL [Ruminococcaceae bacterium]|nr:large conductance mechanosensitive channel protein MscL [Oscillospiraceae bacterium]